MTHLETLKKWIGKTYAETPQLGFQCVAWAKKYCQERGYPIKGFGGSAWKGWQTGSPFDNTWKRVLKTPLNAPSEGDIIFWSEGRCKDGHVAVCSSLCNPILLRCTDQNGGGKGEKIQPRWYTYKNVVGWFTKIK